MTILFIQHVRNEGPGIFKEVLDEMGVSSHILEIFSDKNFFLPTDCRGVIILGGPMNVDDEPKYPFLKEEKEFIKNLLKIDFPLLGICLGAQLIAQVAGGRIFRATEKEIGWYPIRLTGKGEQDPLFQGLPKLFEVFQLHEDTFEIPPKGKRLVTSDGCHNQGFKVGKRGYGLQFHLEADSKMISNWLDANKEDPFFDNVNSVDSLKQQTAKKSPTCLKWGKKLLSNFLQMGTLSK
ncbi:MAG: type 1 glutamine amidotransferase [Deltaproteobacteria bacterium]|nr:type 1 glutamine amidotransferase [Deltaproteobacteria bacterium]